MGNINACVDLRSDSGIAIVTIDNPPVNALRQEVRAGLLAAIGRIADDDAIKAAVLICAGRTFVAGADITEFGKPPRPPSVPDIIAAIEGLPKPVVAALHGTALGGGLELTLGCHYRIAVPETRLGLPEIKLGLIPGAGGTQRLPRLIGVEPALEMILSGEPIGAAQALELGLVDAVVAGDLLTAALAFARQKLGDGGPLPRIRDRDDKLAPLRADPKLFDALAAKVAKRSRGLHAPAAAIAAVRSSLELPIDTALVQERQTFMALLAGDQSKAQRHIFFAEREAAKVSDLPKGTAAIEVGRAAVIGAGTMGGGIAMCFANAGIPVTVIDTGADALARGLETIKRNYQTSVTRGALTSEDMDRRLGLIKGATDLAAVADSEIVIEAVFEEMKLKQSVFGDLDRLAKPDAVLATNTSYLDVDEIARATHRPQAVLGMHFFSPANVMRLVEIVRAQATSPVALASTLAAARRLGKVPVVVGVCHGFVGNRMLRLRSVEAERMLLEGALPQDVDAAIVAFGFPMGPFAMSDLAGLDVSWRMRKAQGLRAVVADALCEAGRFGQKTRRGFYRYEEGSRTPQPDPEVEGIIAESSAKLGVTRRAIPAEEILERLLFPMINEGARILEEKIAQRPGDVDVIWVYGYGWPVWRGGPMYYADQIGLPAVRDRLAFYAGRSG
ncbi:MAG: 3-hydroxyacyl-CoA dehydrogenase NAD-binding domain-containing protein, partial [Xanthobacteraceae bacterium]